jgi:hypothetical protein
VAAIRTRLHVEHSRRERRAVFHLTPIDPFDNAYWYIRFSSMPNAMYFVHKMKVRLPTPTDRAASQAIEWEIQKSLNGKIYNMAWQAEFSGSKWRSFHKIWSGTAWVGHWEDSGITFDPTIWDAGAWVTLESTFLLTPTTITHIDLKINGVTHTVNIVRTPVDKLESNYMTTAFQLDGNGTPTPYNAQVEDYSVEMLTAPGGVPVLPTDPGDASLVFEEIDDSLLFPGNPLPASLMRQVNSNVKMSVARQEFFGPALYGHGSTVPLPVSPIDGYPLLAFRDLVHLGGRVDRAGSWRRGNRCRHSLLGVRRAHRRERLRHDSPVEGSNRRRRARHARRLAASPDRRDPQQHAGSGIRTRPESRSETADRYSADWRVWASLGKFRVARSRWKQYLLFTFFQTSQLPPQSLLLFRNGLVQRFGIDYVLVAGALISFVIPPASDDWLYALYRTDGNTASYNDAVIPSGAIDGVNLVFTLPSAPSPAAFLVLYSRTAKN